MFRCIIGVEELLGGPIHGGVRGTRSINVGVGVALRIGQNSARIYRYGDRFVVMGRIVIWLSRSRSDCELE